MQEFKVNFVELSGKKSKVILNHNLFGRQIFQCDNLKIINDAERLGVVIKECELFIYKRNIIQETGCSISDGKLTITIMTKL